MMPNGISNVSLGDQVTAEEGLPVLSAGSVSSLLGLEAEGQDVSLEGGPGGQGYARNEQALITGQYGRPEGRVPIKHRQAGETGGRLGKLDPRVSDVDWGPN